MMTVLPMIFAMRFVLIWEFGLPSLENADTLSDQDSNSFDDMNEGLVHHFPIHLPNSACSINIFDKNCD